VLSCSWVRSALAHVAGETFVGVYSTRGAAVAAIDVAARKIAAQVKEQSDFVAWWGARR